MKKEVISLFMILILCNLVFASGDVVYLVKRTNQADSNFIKVFNEKGLSVEIVESKKIPEVNFSKYNFIFIGDNRLNNVKYIPSNLPMVVANHYYGRQLGLMNKGRISKLTSNSRMKVNKDGKLIKVYTGSIFNFFRRGFSLYYLSNKYGDGYMNSIAIPHVGSKRVLGDVIAYSKDGNKCFFGITKTKYWTPEAKELFGECISFVIKGVKGPPKPECIINEDCGLPIIELLCNSDSLESITKTPFCTNNHCKNIISDTTQVCEHGCLNKECLAEPIECFIDSDCELDYYSDNYCILNQKIIKDSHDFSCIEKKCIEDITQELVEECLFGCQDNICLEKPETGYGTENHDIKLIENYDGFGHEIKIKDTNNNIIETDTPTLSCGSDYDFQFKSKNIGDFTEDLNILLEIKNQDNTILENIKSKSGLIPNGETTTGNKNNFIIPQNTVPGSYIVSVNISIVGFNDINPQDNFKTRNIEIVC
ncbi:hypothetical protein HOE04_04335 [archaeon]|nr:hypothetical protein [archaeon]